MKPQPEGYRERAIKSLWHVMIATVGVYELRNHKTKVSKFLACGLIAFTRTLRYVMHSTPPPCFNAYSTA